MPQLGLGTWPMNDAETAAAVASAIGLGYRHIDTAEKYDNETGVGEGVRQSGASRSDLFITTKFCRQWHSADGVRQACEASLKRLGMDRSEEHTSELQSLMRNSDAVFCMNTNNIHSEQIHIKSTPTTK